MANFTKRAIVETLLELLEDRPLDKITVSELCKRCEISRNTFYYHFADIFDVVEEIFRDEEARLISDSSSIETIEQGLHEALRLAAEREDAIRHLYSSANRDRLMSYLHNAAAISMGAVVEARAEGRDVSAEDLGAITYLYACMIEGVVLNVLRSGSQNIDAIISDACCYLDGSIGLAIDNAVARGR